MSKVTMRKVTSIDVAAMSERPDLVAAQLGWTAAELEAKLGRHRQLVQGKSLLVAHLEHLQAHQEGDLHPDRLSEGLAATKRGIAEAEAEIGAIEAEFKVTS